MGARRTNKRKNSCSGWHYDQIRSSFHTAWVIFGRDAASALKAASPQIASVNCVPDGTPRANTGLLQCKISAKRPFTSHHEGCQAVGMEIDWSCSTDLFIYLVGDPLHSARSMPTLLRTCQNRRTMTHGISTTWDGSFGQAKPTCIGTKSDGSKEKDRDQTASLEQRSCV